MKVAIISGSNRKDSQSIRVAQFLKKRVEAVSALTPEILDLSELRFSPSPDDNYFGKQDPAFKKIADSIASSDALILISPEWAGAACPLLKALLIFIGKPAAYKPALVVGVSAGKGGAYPIMEIKASGSKNSFIVFIPEHLIFRGVGEMFKVDPPTNPDEKYIHERSDYAIQILESFAKALLPVRNSGVLNLEKYFFGL